MSDAPDFKRYARQVVLREVGVNGQQLLRDSSVLVIGLGGLGSAAALYLAGAGIGRLLLADGDSLESGNLQRQVLYRHSDVGRAKTAAAKAQIAALNPQVCVEEHGSAQWPVTAADVVLDCTDNFSARFAINAACVAARKPLVSGAAIRFEGQLAVFDLRRGGPCYACLYGEDGEQAERCEDAGILGPVVGTIGTLQALAALKLLLGLPAGAGELRVWNALTDTWRVLQLARDPNCLHCGVHP